jgi:hypothetical protein
MHSEMQMNVEGSKKIENYVDVVKLGSFGG